MIVWQANPHLASCSCGGESFRCRECPPPTRWAALGLLCMTAIIQLTYPDGWANFHLYWAAMALAIVTFGPGAVSVDRLLGLDGWSARKAS